MKKMKQQRDDHKQMKLNGMNFFTSTASSSNPQIIVQNEIENISKESNISLIVFMRESKEKHQMNSPLICLFFLYDISGY
jgi:hypothetical protein